MRKFINRNTSPLLLTSSTSRDNSFFSGSIRFVSARVPEFALNKSFSDEKSLRLEEVEVTERGSSFGVASGLEVGGER